MSNSEFQKQENFDKSVRLLRSLQITGTLLISQDQAEAIESLLQESSFLLGAEASSLLLLDEESKELFFAAATGPVSNEIKKVRLKSGEGLAGCVLMTGQPLAISDVSSDPRWKRDLPSMDFAPKSMLVEPVTYGDRIIGIIQFINKTDGGNFTERDMAYAGKIAHVIGYPLFYGRVFLSLRYFFFSLIEHIHKSENEKAGKDDFTKVNGLEASLEMRQEKIPPQVLDALYDLAKALDKRGAIDHSIPLTLEIANQVTRIASASEQGLFLCRHILTGIEQFLVSPAGGAGGRQRSVPGNRSMMAMDNVLD
jgi:putative methionine-R-sulfoxide reductase with GAF domain